MLPILIWLLCCLFASVPCFWFLAHPFAPRWRSRRRSPYYVLLPLWAATQAVLVLVTLPWRSARLYATPFTWIAAVPLVLLGAYVYYRARQGFTASQLAGRPELEAAPHPQRLVVAGVRARVRHPVYLAYLLQMLGLAMGSGLAVAWALTCFAIAAGAAMLRLEDRELEARFGPPYREYRRRVPAFLPRLRKSG